MSVTPANGATGVDRGTAVTIVFSEPLDRATLSTATVRLAAGATPVPSTIAIAADDRSVTLTPSSLLAVNTLYTMTVDAAVTDPGGNGLGTAFVSTWAGWYMSI